MTNQIIRRFQLPGQTGSDNLERHKQTWQNAVIQMMRDEGFVPLLDIDPHFTWTWIEAEKFDFVYTWHGVYVGEDKAWQIEGVLGGRAIPSTKMKK